MNDNLAKFLNKREDKKQIVFLLDLSIRETIVCEVDRRSTFSLESLH